MFLVFLAFFLIPTCFGGKKIDYCDINLNHILCGAEEALENKPQIIHFAPQVEKERRILLRRINLIRDKVAGGNWVMNETHYPTASNMFQLEWCDICEKAAMNTLSRTCWQKKYSFSSLDCCNCENTGEMDLFGFMYYIFFGPEGFFQLNLVQAFVKYLEHIEDNNFKLICLRNVSGHCLDGPPGFFFSLLNARQVKIGCAYVECYQTKEKSKTFGVFACVTNLNFDLDMKGKDHYLTLEPASQCPKPYSSPSWTNRYLCKCYITKGCLVKPAELSSQCTNRKSVALPSIPIVPYAFAVTGPVEILNVTLEDAPATAKKNVTDSGGAKDKSGEKD